MWFGTQDGLNRYDGYHIKKYKNEPNNPNSLSYSEVNCLLEVNNKLFVGTPSGLNILDLTNDSIVRIFFDEKSKNSNVNHINSIKVLSKTHLVLGTDDGIVLFQFEKNEKKIVPFKFDGFKKVNDLLVNGNKVIAATEGAGLVSYEEASGKLQAITLDQDLVKIEDLDEVLNINRMYVYAGKLFLASNGGGVLKVDLSSFEIEKQKKFKLSNSASARNYINDIVIDESIAYCGTNNGFLTYNLLTEDTAVYLKNPDNKHSINDNKIRVVFKDPNENIWLGTYIGGINISFKSSQKFINQFRYKLDEFKNLFLTYEDLQGNVWLSGDKSLRMLPKGQNSFKDLNSITGNYDALCVFQESPSIYWFGTYGIGVKKYDITTNKVQSFRLTEEGTAILSIAKLKGHLLFASYGDGLFIMDLSNNKIENLLEKDGLPNINLTSIFFDKDNNVWILSDGGGAFQLDVNTLLSGKVKILKHVRTSDKNVSIASDVVYSMNQDNNGKLWFGTSNGLSRYDGSTFRNFYESDGLANGFIYSLLKDSVGKFWISTNKGVTAFNPTESDKPFFKNYNLKDGLTNTEHNLGAASISVHGNILVGGPNGYNIFRPSTIKDNLKVPQVHVVSFKRSGKDIALDSNLIYKKHLKLSWRENYFQLEVVALDFIDPEKNLFKYKLEGYDNDWSEPSNIRYISYTELPGGTYTLKIKASNSDGIWNETPYELVITIVPPFWKTTWFYILVVILGTAAVVLFTQLRTRQIKKENKILENKVAERTKELAEKNRDITSSIEYAKRIQEAILPSKDYIFSRLNKAFILYKPKDIVSGDFYWFGEKDGWKIFAVVDCTGHGVPGAFMSMIGHNLMHQIIQEKGITNPGEILNALHKGVQEALRQGNNEVNTNDGMDISIIAINQKTQTHLWAGANRPLIMITEDGEFSKLDGNKYPIGGAQFEVKRDFTTNVLSVHKPCMVYMFSDGYADQFGGDSGKKFMVRRFHDLLMEIHTKSENEQRELLNDNFERWRNQHEQIDDVLVVGIAL